MMRIARILAAAGTGMVLIWAAGAFVNIVRFHRFGWYWKYSQAFFECGLALTLGGLVLATLLRPDKRR